MSLLYTYYDIVDKMFKIKYASDKTFKEKLEIRFIKDYNNAIKFRFLSVTVKLATCILYVVQVLMDKSPYSPTNIYQNDTLNNQIFPENETSDNESVEWFIDWTSVFYVNRHPIVRYSQFGLAVFGLVETVFYFYLTYNGNLFAKVTNTYFIVELICTLPWFIEMSVPDAKNIFIPVFLNCWLVQRTLNYIFKDYNNIYTKHQNSVIGQHLISLGTLLSCLIFTSLCGFQHLQRAKPKNWISLFDSLYYIIITFSTVGYGDITPNSWLSKMFMGIMIIVALIVIPTQLEHLASLWFEKQNLGGSYTAASYDRHIVLCSTNLQYDLIIDFLREFYAHKKNHSVHTVLLSTCELDIQLKSLLHTPIWKQRVFYIHGSVLRDSDLERAKVNQAKAVFILSSRGTTDKSLADQHTILRSWAIKDFAPNTPQFVQLFRPENMIHIKFADYVVCEDEFKYALLANNCLCPGISTLVTLLLHKSVKEREPQHKLDDWQEQYGKLAGNEIHSIIAEGSKFFQEFIGDSFTYASCIAHKKYNVCLIGVATKKDHQSSSEVVTNNHIPSASKQQIYKTNILDEFNQKEVHLSKTTSQLTFMNRKTLLNPGSSYRIQPNDICFYISLVKEENYELKALKIKSPPIDDICQNLAVSGPDLSLRRLASELANKNNNNLANGGQHLYALDTHASEYSSSWKDNIKKSNSESTSTCSNINDSELTIGTPPNPLYIGCFPTLCKLLKTPTKLCCLELNSDCEHKCHSHASEYKWRNKCIILAAENATNGLFNFILPLRSQVRSTMFLRPIVLLLENRPSIEFLESICCFPLIYWLHGSISNISTLLRAGIMDSDLIVASTERYENFEDDSLADCSNIVSVQNIHRLFPKTNVVAELLKASNIRFMKFRAKDMQKEKSSNMAYMYRLPFAAGHVFSGSMIDTLLYQTFGKPYLIELIRLLIGLNQSEGSGNLTSIPLAEEDMWIKTYGNLYKKLTSSSGEVPIGLYRTEQTHDIDIRRKSKCEIEQLILIKMSKLGMDSSKYNSCRAHNEQISFVFINPSNDFQLKVGDIIYLLKPGQISHVKTEYSTQMDIKSENPMHSSLNSLKSLFNTVNSYKNSFSSQNEPVKVMFNTINKKITVPSPLPQSKSETAKIDLITEDEPLDNNPIRTTSETFQNKRYSTLSFKDFPSGTNLPNKQYVVENQIFLQEEKMTSF